MQSNFYEVELASNGFILEFRKQNDDDMWSRDKMIFNTWDALIEFIKDKPIMPIVKKLTSEVPE
jgi:hypothetical protein